VKQTPILVLLLMAGCRDPVFSDMSDSTYVRTMVAAQEAAGWPARYDFSHPATGFDPQGLWRDGGADRVDDGSSGRRPGARTGYMARNRKPSPAGHTAIKKERRPMDAAQSCSKPIYSCFRIVILRVSGEPFTSSL
jgi:hypothetical protein